MQNKTIGTTTLSTVGGSGVGYFVAQFIIDVFHLQLSDGGQMGLGLLLIAAGGLLMGFLSPSKKAEVEEVIERVKPDENAIAEAVAQNVSVDVPSAAEVARHVVAGLQTEATPAVSTDTETGSSARAGSVREPAAPVVVSDSYPDLDALAKAEAEAR